jgi:hypothetical protein
VKIEAILLHSERFAELADFYRRALDQPEPTPYGSSHLGFPGVSPYLGFDDDAYGPVSIWLRVDDIDAAIEKLLGLGATELTKPTNVESPGELIARVRDPAGNVLGLIADAPAA